MAESNSQKYCLRITENYDNLNLSRNYTKCSQILAYSLHYIISIGRSNFCGK